MSNPTSKWFGYYQVITDLTAAGWDFSTGHTCKVALFTSASSAINRAVNPATYTAFAADGNEVAATGGYSTGGVSVGPLVRNIINGQAQLNLGIAIWTPTGSGFTWRAAVLYDFTDSSKRALAYSLGNSAPADSVEMAGLPLVIPVSFWNNIQWG